MKYGYVRVSTREQNEDRQMIAMQNFGVDKVYADKQSGKDFARPQYQKMLHKLKKTILLLSRASTVWEETTMKFWINGDS